MEVKLHLTFCTLLIQDGMLGFRCISLTALHQFSHLLLNHTHENQNIILSYFSVCKWIINLNGLTEFLNLGCNTLKVCSNLDNLLCHFYLLLLNRLFLFFQLLNGFSPFPVMLLFAFPFIKLCLQIINLGLCILNLTFQLTHCIEKIKRILFLLDELLSKLHWGKRLLHGLLHFL